MRVQSYIIIFHPRWWQVSTGLLPRRVLLNFRIPEKNLVPKPWVNSQRLMRINPMKSMAKIFMPLWLTASFFALPWAVLWGVFSRDRRRDESYQKHPFKESLHTLKLVIASEEWGWKTIISFQNAYIFQIWLDQAVWTHQYCSHSTATVLLFNQALVIGPSIQVANFFWGLELFWLGIKVNWK